MKLIVHRRNMLSDLIATPTKYGIEVDIRSYGDKLVIHHEPFIKGESFEDWLAAYQHGMLILNVKEEGLEARLIELMRMHGITDYFFLDQSFPFLVKWSKAGERRCAVRVSGVGAPPGKRKRNALSLTIVKRSAVRSNNTCFQ